MSSGREVVEIELGWRGQLLVDDLVAEIDALVADVDARSSDELLDLSLTLAAEAAEELLVALARPSHVSPFTPISGLGEGDIYERCSITVSMSPYSLASGAVM